MHRQDPRALPTLGVPSWHHGRMRNSRAVDEPEDVEVDDLVGPAVKGDVEDLDPSGWVDEAGDGDTPGPDRKPSRKSGAKGRTSKPKGKDT